MGTSEERMIYRCDKCWDCLFCEEPYCRHYGKHFDYKAGEPDKKPEWCRIQTVTIEFGG